MLYQLKVFNQKKEYGSEVRVLRSDYLFQFVKSL